MTTQISKSNSHRRLIKEKTNQLVDLRRLAPKTALNIKVSPASNVSEAKCVMPPSTDELNTSF